MSIDKKISYVEQDGSLNFIKNSESVTVPKRFKARKNAPATKLAYITDAEAKMLKKMKKGTPHKGPKGIPSYDSFGSIDASGRDTGRAGSEVSAAETGNFSGFDGSPSVELPPGVTPKGSKEAQDLRSAAITAGAGQRVNPGFFDSRDVISPQELARARAFAKDRSNRFAKGAMRKTRGGGLMGFLTGGGFLGNIIRSLGQRFGLGKTFDQPTYDMSEGNKLGLFGLMPEDFEDDPKISDTSFTLNDPNAIITGTNYPGSNQNLMTSGVVDGPFKGMFDYLEEDPSNFGITQTKQFQESPFGLVDMEENESFGPMP